MPSLCNPLECKAMTIIWALQTRLAATFVQLEVESDNPQVVSCIHSFSLSLNALGLLVKDIVFLSKFFLCVKFGFCYKKTNEITHHLIRLASLLFFLYIWMEEILPPIRKDFCRL